MPLYLVTQLYGLALDAARPIIARLEERVEALESRLEASGRSDTLESRYTTAIHAALVEERTNHRSEIGGLRDHYNDHLVRLHGAPQQ